MSTPLVGTVSAKGAIDRVRYSHDAMIDYIIANPGCTQNAIAKEFGYTVPWVSRVFCSDAFHARLAQRKAEIVDPTILEAVEGRLKGLAMQSAEILADKLASTNNPDLALKALELTTKALGYGAKKENVQVQNSFVVAMPGMMAGAEEWANRYGSPGKSSIPGVLDVSASVSSTPASTTIDSTSTEIKE